MIELVLKARLPHLYMQIFHFDGALSPNFCRHGDLAASAYVSTDVDNHGIRNSSVLCTLPDFVLCPRFSHSFFL